MEKKTTTKKKRSFKELATSHVVQHFGGINAFARAIDVPVNTAQYWVDQGRIPEEASKKITAAMRLRIPEILRLASLGDTLRP